MMMMIMETEKSRSTAPGGGNHCSHWRPRQAAQVLYNIIIITISSSIVVDIVINIVISVVISIVIESPPLLNL